MKYLFNPDKLVGDHFAADCMVTLSGGIDSTVLVHELVYQGFHPMCVYVSYGSKSELAEKRCAIATARQFDLPLVEVKFPYKDLATAYILGNTAEYEEGTQFWLEGRNAIICMSLAVLASNLKFEQVFIGINASDSKGNYIDTDARFVAAVNMLITCSCRSKVTVRAPWIEMGLTKIDVIKKGIEYKVDFEKYTHSCSNSEGKAKPCCDYWNCDSCYYRRLEFESLGIDDPFLDPAKKGKLTGPREIEE